MPSYFLFIDQGQNLVWQLQAKDETVPFEYDS